MPIYRNNALKSAESAEVQAGPYTFKHGHIRTTQADDSTVGPILTTFYGCEKLSDDEEAELEFKIQEAHKAKANLEDTQLQVNPSTGKQTPEPMKNDDPKDLTKESTSGKSNDKPKA